MSRACFGRQAASDLPGGTPTQRTRRTAIKPSYLGRGLDLSTRTAGRAARIGAAWPCLPRIGAPGTALPSQAQTAAAAQTRRLRPVDSAANAVPVAGPA